MKAPKLARIVMVAFSILAETLEMSYSTESITEEEKEEISRKVWAISEFDLKTIEEALKEFYIRNGLYPASLDDLIVYKPNGEKLSIPLDDPFDIIIERKGIEKKIRYGRVKYERAVGRHDECYVWYSGPDGIDNRHAVEYKQENGSISEGDIGIRLIKNETTSLVDRKNQNN